MDQLWSDEAFDAAVSVELGRIPSPMRGLAAHALAGGKRLRPRLVAAFAAAVGAGGREESDRVAFGVAVELIHKASLIQDDLPCMDSASERDGRPALHTLSSSAEAVLVSDALIAHAFRLCGESARPAEAVSVLADAVTVLCAGQAGDLTSHEPDTDVWETVSDAKTGALFSAAARLGVLAGGGDNDERMRLDRIATEFGVSLGRVYQWHDDAADGDSSLPGSDLPAREAERLRRLTVAMPRPGPVGAYLESLRRMLAGRASRVKGGAAVAGVA